MPVVDQTHCEVFRAIAVEICTRDEQASAPAFLAVIVHVPCKAVADLGQAVARVVLRQCPANRRRNQCTTGVWLCRDLGCGRRMKQRHCEDQSSHGPSCRDDSIRPASRGIGSNVRSRRDFREPLKRDAGHRRAILGPSAMAEAKMPASRFSTPIFVFAGTDAPDRVSRWRSRAAALKGPPYVRRGVTRGGPFRSSRRARS